MPIVDNQVLDAHYESSQRGRLPEALRRRAAYLLEPDRTLFQLLISGTVSRRQVARMLEVPPGTVTRRVRRLANRLHDPIVVALLDERCPLAPEYRQLGIEHFLQGRSIPRMADQHQLSVSRVRDSVNFIRGWHSRAATSRVVAARASL